MEKLTYAASILGLMSIGSMIATMVTVNIPLKYTNGDTSVVIADVINGIVPCLLPLLFTGFIYWLVTKKKMKTTWALILIFIIGIPGKTGQFHALHVIQCAAKRLTMDTDFLLGCFGLFGFKANAFLTANLLAVQPGGQKALTGALVQIGNFFFGLLKGQLDLLLSQSHQILVDALQDEVYIRPCHGNAAGQGFFVGLGVDVVLFQEHQPDALMVEILIQ